MKRQRWEEAERDRDRREETREEKGRRKKIKVCEKVVEKSRNTVFFKCFVAP